MNKHAWWAWATKNSVIMICWTVLAIIFGQWWIALFGAAFLTSLKTERNVTKKGENDETDSSI